MLPLLDQAQGKCVVRLAFNGLRAIDRGSTQRFTLKQCLAEDSPVRQRPAAFSNAISR